MAASDQVFFRNKHTTGGLLRVTFGKAQRKDCSYILTSIFVQLGGPRQDIAKAEQERWRAISEDDEEALLKANAGLLAAMLDCQFGNVVLHPDSQEIDVQVTSCPLFPCLRLHAFSYLVTSLCTTSQYRYSLLEPCLSAS